MIDGLKLRVHGESLHTILQCRQLNFINNSIKRQAKYKGLIIEILENPFSCYIKGSIHKFSNEGKHNANLFTLEDFIRAIIKLEDELHINRYELTVHRIEVGVNVSLPYPPEHLISDVTRINAKKPNDHPYGLEVHYQQYSFKIYSKSKQVKEYKKNNILRFEIAFHKMIKFNLTVQKIITLDELTDISVWQKMALMLKDKVRCITMVDYNDLNRIEMTINEALLFYEWSNPIRLNQEHNRLKKSRRAKSVELIYYKYANNTKRNELILLTDKQINLMCKYDSIN